MKAKLIKKQSAIDDYQIHSLTLNNVYEVLGIEADDYRIIDEDNEPYLFPPDCFEIVDNSIPAFWKTEYGEDKERYSYPPRWFSVGFFEDYFDNVKEVRDQFWKEYKEYYGS
jgi:hypothetical protein